MSRDFRYQIKAKEKVMGAIYLEAVLKALAEPAKPPAGQSNLAVS
jgi:hypothetical protein